jgi:enamine deaminase RidA (YjgF/YER057c/UK114 family)
MTATPEQQYEQALRNIAALLKAEGSGPQNLVKVTTYLVQPIAPESARKIREAVLGPAKPASTLVYVVRLARPDIFVEVEAVAVRPTYRPG